MTTKESMCPLTIEYCSQNGKLVLSDGLSPIIDNRSFSSIQEASDYASENGYLLSTNHFQTSSLPKPCECHRCFQQEKCTHHGAFRRLPKSEGGLGLCPRL